MSQTLKKSLYRGVHRVMRPVMPFIKVPEPELLTGAGSVKKLPGAIKENGIGKVLIVTDRIIMSLGLVDGLMEALKEQGVQYEVFDDVQPNPSIQNIEDGLKKYQDSGCEALIGFGGGSPMDCCKIIGARVTNPDKTVKDIRGKFKIKKDIPIMFAVPTTAGTGSEATAGAVVTDPSNHEKFTIGSLKIVPKYAVLDPELMLGLPPDITAATGMDVLTHAIEAYISLYANRFTDDMAERAVRIVFDDLESLYRDGSDLNKRNNMALASYYAGVSFTRALVGYVHAIAHRMGGMYGVTHGVANAIILPYVLEYSRKDIVGRLARLAWIGGLGSPAEPEEELCDRFIEKVKSLNRNMGIPTYVKEIQEKDIPIIAKRALREANPDYPVPTLMDQGECETFIRKLLKRADT